MGVERTDTNMFVINVDGTNIRMLSKYNLDIGNIYDSEKDKVTAISNPTGRQLEKARGFIDEESKYYGVIKYSSSLYWNDSTNIKTEYGTSYPSWVYTNLQGNVDLNNLVYPHVKKYENYLKDSGLTSASATIMNYEQAADLGCQTVEPYSCKDAPKWLYSTSYWLGTASNNTSMWCISSRGSGLLANDGKSGKSRGIRLLITISVEQLN